MQPLRTLLLCLLGLVVLLASSVSGALHDHTRGMKTHNLPEDEVEKYVKSHHADTIVNKHKTKDELKDHPEVKRFLEWHAKRKEGHPEAAAAFAGKIPHDFLPHLAAHDQHDQQAEPQQPEGGAEAGVQALHASAAHDEL